MKYKDQIGIVSYGTAIPKYRITTKEIAAGNNKQDDAGKSLGLVEKAVAAPDQDSITLAVEAALEAWAKIKADSLGAIYVGSESHPYAVKPTAVTVGEALGIDNRYTAADFEFACKAGTAAMQAAVAQVVSGFTKHALAIGTDTAQSRPGDALEYTAAGAAAAYLVGTKNIIAKILYSTSLSSDTPDFWRREHQTYPEHGSRFTGEPAYFKHISGNIRQLLSESKMEISDFEHIVLHMPNGRFPLTIAKQFGIAEDQLSAGFTVKYLGNSYSACSMVGLAAVLDVAKPKQRILVVSYGSGSGSDAFILETTPLVTKIPVTRTVAEKINDKSYLIYSQYLKFRQKLRS